MKNLKTFAPIISAVILIGIVSGIVYYTNTHAKIEGEFCTTDIKEIRPNLQYTKIKEINKCTEVEKMLILSANEDDISKFIDFHNLSEVYLSCSKVNSSDSMKIGAFINLRKLYLYYTAIDLEGFDSNNLSYFGMLGSEIKHIDSLAKCASLKSITITDSTIDDSIVFYNGRLVMKDSGFLSSFDNLSDLTIEVDSIEDVSGICEMDSLQEFSVKAGTISDEQKQYLENSGIKVTMKKDS
jgi:Leucine-rich repeat (LRR) protein